MRSWLDLRSFLAGLGTAWGRPYKQEVGGSNPSAPIRLTGLGVSIPAVRFPLFGVGKSPAATFKGFPESVFVSALVTRTGKATNHGRRSRKSNWDCTICHSCRWRRIGLGRLESPGMQ